jgi:hypothetical protein
MVRMFLALRGQMAKMVLMATLALMVRMVLLALLVPRVHLALQEKEDRQVTMVQTGSLVQMGTRVFRECQGQMAEMERQVPKANQVRVVKQEQTVSQVLRDLKARLEKTLQISRESMQSQLKSGIGFRSPKAKLLRLRPHLQSLLTETECPSKWCIPSSTKRSSTSRKDLLPWLTRL